MSENSQSAQIIVLCLLPIVALTVFYMRECISTYFALGFSKSAGCVRKAEYFSAKYPLRDKISQKYMREHISNEYYLKKYDLYMRIKHVYIIFCAVSFVTDEIFIIFSLYDNESIYSLFKIKLYLIWGLVFVFVCLRKKAYRLSADRKPNKKNK